MPQPRKPQIQGRVPEEQERLKIERSLTGREQSPSTRSQAQTWVSWKDLGRRLGQPFEAEQVPYSRLRQMRRDPMIAFGLHYVKTPLVKAQWRIECEDPQVAAFIDYAWRKVHARYMFQRGLALDFGFSAITKRFELDFPMDTYRSPETPDTPSPVWSEGNVPALVWKPFVAIPPELADPVFDEATGELMGMNYAGPTIPGAGGGGSDAPDIDIYHTLWGTNEKDSVFGSLYGFPRISYAYRYWWSYWFRWALYDRFFERAAVPPLKVWHPNGVYEDPLTGETLEFSEVAYEAGNRIRANGIVTMPSELAESRSINGASGGQRSWDMEYMDAGQPPVDFDDSFNYLDVMKLRSMWVPEQAFIEGEGGTSSRNVAAQMAEIFIESQANLMAEIDDEINRFIIPQLVAVNFPEFEGVARKVTTGFAQEDTDMLKQIVQLVGQANPASLGVDVKTALQRFGIPVLSPQEAAAQQQQLLQQQTAPTAAAPVSGGPAGTIPTPGTATGFSYIGSREVIHLSDDDEFAIGLPSSRHFQDERTRKLTLRLHKLYRKDFRERVKDIAEQIEREDLKLTLSEAGVEFADEDSAVPEAAATVVSITAAKRAAKKIVDAWEWPQEKLAQLAGATANVLGRIFGFALSDLGDHTGLDKRPDKDFVKQWSFDRAETLAAQTDKSLRDEMQNFIMNALLDGHVEPDDLAKEMRSHFSDRPASKSETVAVTETVGAWNRATLELAAANGVKQVQAVDAQKGPTDRTCEERDQKLFTVKRAVKEDEKERHPNCTLEWRILRPEVEVSLAYRDDMDPNQMAAFDPESNTVWFSEDTSRPERKRYMEALGRSLEAVA